MANEPSTHKQGQLAEWATSLQKLSVLMTSHPSIIIFNSQHMETNLAANANSLSHCEHIGYKQAELMIASLAFVCLSYC